MKKHFAIIFITGFFGVYLGFFFTPTVFAEDMPFAETNSETPSEETTASAITGQQLLVTIPTPIVENAVQELEDHTDVKVLRALDTTNSTTTLVVSAPIAVDATTITSIIQPTGPTTVQADVIRRAQQTEPNDTFYNQQWHHSGFTSSIGTPSGWDTTTGSAAIVIAVIDGGVDIDHPDLQNNIWINTDEIANNGVDDDSNGFVDDVNGYDFTTGTADPNPSPNGVDEDRDGFVDAGVNHGTHVAGIIAAEGNNSTGVVGVMWDAQIMPVQVLDDEGAGFDSDIAEGIRYAADNGADIINLSLGGYGSTTVLQDAVAYAVRKGSLIVAAAGNDGTNISTHPFYPACYSDVIGVASVGQSGVASSFSNFGSNCVDVSAPGELIVSTFYQDTTNPDFVDFYGLESGTSMATPVVSGVAGLLLSVNTIATRSQLAELVVAASHTQSGLSSEYGIGIIDASKVSQDIVLSTITAFDSAKKKTTFKSTHVYAVQKPYFEWKTVAGADIDAYYVYFGTNPNASPVRDGVRQTSKTFTPTTRAIGNEKTYYLRVQAQTAAGGLSNIVTYAYIVDTVVSAPQKPTVKQVKASAAVAVTWKKVTKQNVVQYQVLRKKKSGGSRSVIKKTTKGSFTDTTVKRGATYEYSVKAKDDLGNIKESKRVTIKVQ